MKYGSSCPSSGVFCSALRQYVATPFGVSVIIWSTSAHSFSTGEEARYTLSSDFIQLDSLFRILNATCCYAVFLGPVSFRKSAGKKLVPVFCVFQQVLTLARACLARCQACVPIKPRLKCWCGRDDRFVWAGCMLYWCRSSFATFRPPPQYFGGGL